MARSLDDDSVYHLRHGAYVRYMMGEPVSQTYAVLAKRYHLSVSTIQQIVRGEMYLSADGPLYRTSYGWGKDRSRTRKLIVKEAEQDEARWRANQKERQAWEARTSFKVDHHVDLTVADKPNATNRHAFKTKAKTNQGQAVWDTLLSRWPLTGKLLILPGPTGQEIPLLINRGAYIGRIALVDNDAANIRRAKRRWKDDFAYDTPGELPDAVAGMMAKGIHVSRANLDFCRWVGKIMIGQLQLFLASPVLTPRSRISITWSQPRDRDAWELRKKYSARTLADVLWAVIDEAGYDVKLLKAAGYWNKKPMYWAAFDLTRRS